LPNPVAQRPKNLEKCVSTEVDKALLANVVCVYRGNLCKTP